MGVMGGKGEKGNSGYNMNVEGWGRGWEWDGGEKGREG